MVTMSSHTSPSLLKNTEAMLFYLLVAMLSGAYPFHLLEMMFDDLLHRTN